MQRQSLFIKREGLSKFVSVQRTKGRQFSDRENIIKKGVFRVGRIIITFGKLRFILNGTLRHHFLLPENILLEQIVSWSKIEYLNRDLFNS